MFTLKVSQWVRKTWGSSATRKPSRSTTRLWLEALEDRTLPSASTLLPVVSEASTQAAAAMPYLTSAMDQLNQLIVTLEQNAIGAYQTLSQEIVQEGYSVLHQLGNFLGINPVAQTSTPDTSLNAAVSQSQPGSVSGNVNATTTVHESAQPEMRSSPNSVPSPTGPYLVGVDEYLWDPQNPATDISASNPVNWLKNGKRQNNLGTVPGNNAADTANFDPTNSLIQDGNGNSDINWDYSKPFSTMNLGGTGAYTGKQTIQSDITVELSGADGSSLNMTNTSSNLYLQFSDSTSVFQIDNIATITNMNLTGVSSGQFIVHGGLTTMAQSASYTEKLGVQFTVDADATVDDQSYTPIQLTAGNPGALIITIHGNMYFHWGPNNGIQLISGGGTYPADFIGVYGGFLGYYGTQDVKDTLTVPVDVRSGGTFRVSIDVDSTNPQNGFLIVQGAAPDGGGPSVYMTGASSSVQLAYGDTLECDKGYVQDDGDLMTTDDMRCWLQVGANGNGTADINGGELIIDNPNIGYGQLVVTAAKLNFDGELLVAIDATNQNNRDMLSVLSNVGTTINLEANSTVFVSVRNAPPLPNQQWVIIEGLINPIIGKFSSLTTSPKGINLTDNVNPKDATQYIVAS